DGRVASYAGRSVIEPELAVDLLADLERRDLLVKSEQHEHSYPHCWRCGTRLIYYAKPSWYIATSSLRDRLLAANETVQWHPPGIKHGRFGDWLAGNVDWALSRERYWGTPLPIWRCDRDPEHRVCIGSFAELERRTGTPIGDPHRPYVDELTFACDCGGAMTRVSEVIDVWFDSGSMPFAQHHAPFENEDIYESTFPADFVCEALDQTRGWFYSLIAISTLLNDCAPYRNVVCLGLLVDGEGRKMSKSLGNVVVPWEVIDRFGADAFRWYFFTSKQPWDGYRFSVDAVGDAVRLFLRQLWNVYSFHVLYTNAAQPGQGGEGERSDLDSWALSRLAATVETVRERLDAYDATLAGKAIADFVEDLSNWYVRRSRRRFWDGDAAALATLQKILVTLAKLLAPFTPFVADEIYDNLDGELGSVHLCDFPEPCARDLELEFAMATARETVRLGLAARGQGNVKLRQPLREAVIVAAGRERGAVEGLSELVREELNVASLRFVDAADELGTYTIKPNLPALGPRFGARMPELRAAITALEPTAVAASFREGRTVVVSIAGSDHELIADDLLVSIAPLEGYGLEREGSHAVALELALDDELIRAGLAREVVHAIQQARRGEGLEITDRIELVLGGDPPLLEAAREHQDYVTGETLATAFAFEEREDWTATVSIDGFILSIWLRRAES
ncbi:MAG TPA: class I tRNA ligase family protein, partial [Solirubrobacteraceae bacterium]|nr:class I tRNA ligase family protein [Solirubrobacteraceae bacterium]